MTGDQPGSQPSVEDVSRAADLLGIPIAGVGVDEVAVGSRPEGRAPARQVTVALAELAAGLNALQYRRDMTIDGLHFGELRRLVATVEERSAGGDRAGMLNSALWRLHLAAHTLTAIVEDNEDTRDAVTRLVGSAAGLIQCWRRGTDRGPDLDVTEISKARARASDAMHTLDRMLPAGARQHDAIRDGLIVLVKAMRRRQPPRRPQPPRRRACGLGVRPGRARDDHVRSARRAVGGSGPG